MNTPKLYKMLNILINLTLRNIADVLVLITITEYLYSLLNIFLHNFEQLHFFLMKLF